MKDKSNFVHWFIAVLLIALIASNVYFATLVQRERRAQVEYIEERRVIYDEQVKQARILLDRQRRIVAGATDSYRTDAYDLSIERIAEQQLIAAEYQMLLLQTIAQQNAQMIELMLVEP